MNRKTFPFNLSRFFKLVSICLAAILLASAVVVRAQQPQLSLADLLIGLRSKKATLQQRNEILTEAIKQRGVTFTLSPEIEKELTATGADKSLLDAIRQKGAIIKTAAVTSPISNPVPASTPPPPDFSFYQKRADVSLGKGEFAVAIADYDKSVELKADNAVAYVNRGKAQFNLKAYEKAVADFDKAISIDGKIASAFLNRGMAYEKLGDSKKAIADFQSAIQLDSANEFAKANLKRLQDEEAAALEKAKTPPAPLVVPEPVKRPEFINLGGLTASNAIRMATPTYSIIAQRSNVEGRVSVDVKIDEKGNVTSAKATTGHQLLRGSAEDAARKSKFKPAVFDGQPIKAIGTITYNFSLKGR